TKAFQCYEAAAKSTSVSIRAEAEHHEWFLLKNHGAYFLNDKGLSSDREIADLLDQAKADGYGSNAGKAGQADLEAYFGFQNAGEMDKAIGSLQKALRAGNAGAVNALGFCYATGYGYPKDLVKAEAQ